MLNECRVYNEFVNGIKSYLKVDFQLATKAIHSRHLLYTVTYIYFNTINLAI